MASTLIGGVFQTLQDLGAFQYVLFPLMTFAIVYGVLSKVSPFDEDQNQINVVIALVIALFAAIYVPFGGSMVVFLSNLFGAWAVVLVVILLGMTGAGLLGVSFNGEDGVGGRKWVAGLAVLVLFFVFFSWGGVSMVLPTGVAVPGYFLSTQDMLAIVVLALGAAAVWYVGFAGDESGKGDTAEPDDDD